ncbi:MAG TPA: ATPase domain-containing protein [Nitrososphaera sp.]|nr:ATPase domain-containing protein [Nitrososphaera sp.]
MTASLEATTIPGAGKLLGGRELPDGLVILLLGPSGAGKTVYCQQVVRDGIAYGDYCVWVSSSMSEKEFGRTFLPNVISSPRLKFVGMRPEPPLDASGIEWTKSLQNTVQYVSRLMQEARTRYAHPQQRQQTHIRLIVDSLTQLRPFVDEDTLCKFVSGLSFAVKQAGGAIGIVTLNDAGDDRVRMATGSVCDGIIEIKVDEEAAAVAGGANRRPSRSARIVHMRGVRHEPSWAHFTIDNDGLLVFGDQTLETISCVLCGRPITGAAVMEEDFTFDTKVCSETYRKLTKLYGANISSRTGLPSEAVNVNFFFVDIVGLSDPRLSVRKQIEKIRVLNGIVDSSETFRKVEDKRFVLPTGDGMAIGFLMDPVLPLKLSIELHRKLSEYNRHRPAEEDRIGVRIGLSSGPVFVVSDIMDKQNVWGPGIILARRVMDLGDNGHILLGEKMVEELMSRDKEEYRRIIKLVSANYQIKHGQVIKVYSAHSEDFGNPAVPSRIAGSA